MRRPGYLVAAGVLAFLAVSLWYLVLSPTPTDPASIDPSPSEQSAAEAAPEADLEAMECRLDVERWDAGDRAAVERKYGENAEAVVEGCRAVALPRVSE